MAAPKKGGLGRGLDALFADVPVKAPKETEVIKNREDGDEKDTVRKPWMSKWHAQTAYRNVSKLSET